MTKTKPFDLLVIVDPQEYQFDFTKSEEGLRELSDLCREHQIPVRVRGHKGQDGLVRPHFNGCDYDGYEDTTLASLGSSDEVRIMLTGGNFAYGGVLEGEIERAGLTKDQVANFNPDDPKREFAVGSGCVSYVAAELHKEIVKRGKKPTMHVDSKSLASSERTIDRNTIYVVYYVGIRNLVIGSHYLIVKKVPRSTCLF